MATRSQAIRNRIRKTDRTQWLILVRLYYAHHLYNLANNDEMPVCLDKFLIGRLDLIPFKYFPPL